MRNLIIIILIVFVLSCKTNPPNSWEETTNFGKVFVSSNLNGAEIIVGDELTGQFTPDTLTLNEGTYFVSLQKSGYISDVVQTDVIKDSVVAVEIGLKELSFNKTVLIEDFSNSSCGPCVTSNNILRSLKKSYASDELIAIKFTASFPSPNDPMYLANTEDSDTRLQYYTIFSTPTIIVDGINKTVATDSMSIKAKIDASLQQFPKFTIEVEDSISGQTIHVKGKVKLLDNSGIDFNSLVLHTVIIETKIEYSSPPGSNGETEFDDVMRKMLPTSTGYPISQIENENEVEFEWSANINSQWNKNRLETVVYIQHTNSKEVYQAYSTIN